MPRPRAQVVPPRGSSSALRRLAVALTAALGLPFPAAAQLPPPLGPLGAEEGAPFQRLGYTPMVEAADPVPRGRVRVDSWLGYTNLFEEDSTSDHVFHQDMERALLAVTVRYGVADGLEVAARTTLENDWGGFIDPVIVAFHAAIGMGDRHRTAFPDGQYGVYLRDGAGRTRIEVPRTRLGLDDVRLSAKWRVAGGDRGVLAVRGVVRVPTRRPTVGSVRTDGALLVQGRLRGPGVHLHGMAGVSTVRRNADMRDLMRGREVFGMLGVERPLRAGLAAVVEWTGSSQLLRDVGDHDLDGAPTNVVFGVAGVRRSGWRWEIAMQEDFPPRGPSLDFTIQLALGRSW